jgi:transcriptional regulator with XRE-family HTH domain
MSPSNLVEDLRSRRALTPALARAIRKASGATQGEVAGALGVHRVTIARYESGARIPRGDLARRYMRLLQEISTGV